MKHEDFQRLYVQKTEESGLTFLSVLRKKVLLWVEKSKAGALLRALVELLCMFVLSVALISPKYAIQLVVFVLSAGGFAFPKAIISCLLVRKRKLIYRLFQRQEKIASERIEGVPKNELLHFIFETGGFKLEDCKKRLGIGLGVYNRLSKKLEAMGIFTRGANNSRVLSQEFSREQVRDILSGADSAKELTSFRVDRGGEKSIRSLDDMEDRLENVFKVRKI